MADEQTWENLTDNQKGAIKLFFGNSLFDIHSQW